MKSVIKWAGGKSQLLTDIINKLPKNKEDIHTYIEPFIGSATVLLNIIHLFPNVQNIIISDINFILYLLYRTIKYDPHTLILFLNELEIYYKNSDNPKQFYDKVKSEFNTLKTEMIYDNVNMFPYDYIILQSARFIFLNKTCFNGLYRENKKGEFNVPWNKNVKVKICDPDIIKEISTLLNNKNVIIENLPYDECIKKYLTDNSFVYLDPPYRPINKTSAFTAYTKSGFNDDNQKELKLWCDTINNNNSYFMQNNSDPHNTDITDNFFDDLYTNYNISRVYASRSINSNGNKRGKITELLITNYETDK